MIAGAVSQVPGLLPALPVAATWGGAGSGRPAQVQAADFPPAGQPAQTHRLTGEKVRAKPTPETQCFRSLFIFYGSGPTSEYGSRSRNVTLNFFLTKKLDFFNFNKQIQFSLVATPSCLFSSSKVILILSHPGPFLTSWIQIRILNTDPDPGSC